MLQLMRTTPMRLRILISVVIGVASAVFCWAVLTRLHQGAADFTWAIRAAQHLLAGKNPYDTPLEQYPLTAALFGLPNNAAVSGYCSRGVSYGFFPARRCCAARIAQVKSAAP